MCKTAIKDEAADAERLYTALKSEGDQWKADADKIVDEEAVGGVFALYEDIEGVFPATIWASRCRSR